MKQYQKKDRAAYQVAYEVLSKRNSTILGLIGFGVVWVGLFFAVFNVQWFAFESIDAFIDLNSQTDDEQSNYNGGIWWSLLAVFLFSLAFAPIAFGVTMMTYRNEDVTDKWKKELFGLLSSIPTSDYLGLTLVNLFAIYMDATSVGSLGDKLVENFPISIRDYLVRWSAITFRRYQFL